MISCGRNTVISLCVLVCEYVCVRDRAGAFILLSLRCLLAEYQHWFSFDTNSFLFFVAAGGVVVAITVASYSPFDCNKTHKLFRF